MARLLDVIEAGDTLGEGPLWEPRGQALWWTDIQSRRLRRLDLSSRTIADTPAPERVGSFAFHHDDPGRMLVAFESGLAWWTPGGGAPDWVARPEVGATGRRFNDGRADRQGRFWCGTMVEDPTLAAPGSAALWRFGLDGVFAPASGDVTISNGLAASPDGRTLYFADSPKGLIFSFDLDPETGRLGPRRLFAEAGRGSPDGAAVDAEGRLWSARWGAGQVVRHRSDGSVAEVVDLPVSQPTCVAFGGADLRLMFVTSARDGLTDEALSAQPLAGALFVFETDVPGLADAGVRAAPPFPGPALPALSGKT